MYANQWVQVESHLFTATGMRQVIRYGKVRPDGRRLSDTFPWFFPGRRIPYVGNVGHVCLSAEWSRTDRLRVRERPECRQLCAKIKGSADMCGITKQMHAG
ncbi:hypothetical protein SKAU_G00241980 [Synaphobranchus kaupii]|uniref:Uncharacterized protein n=1 Tax=Synaphobranchus kaupii TaxID=118154 RepID=A0A9Q1ITZ2_SYNKA|nr:hypothetical protein SKAU_G00241980 [Synaphobranchus kaupii]